MDEMAEIFAKQLVCDSDEAINFFPGIPHDVLVVAKLLHINQITYVASSDSKGVSVSGLIGTRSQMLSRE